MDKFVYKHVVLSGTSLFTINNNKGYEISLSYVPNLQSNSHETCIIYNNANKSIPQNLL